MWTPSRFGDVLMDGAAAVVGSIGLLASARIGSGSGGIFEPVHGSAPDIAGTGTANPLAMILSAALLLRHVYSLEEEAAAIESAVGQVLEDGLRTRDLIREGDVAGTGASAGVVGTEGMGAAVAAAITNVGASANA